MRSVHSDFSTNQLGNPVEREPDEKVIKRPDHEWGRQDTSEMRREHEADEPFRIDGGWTRWAEWSPCSQTCGGGAKSRRRSCEDPAPKDGGQYCLGSAVEITTCEYIECPRMLHSDISINPLSLAPAGEGESP